MWQRSVRITLGLAAAFLAVVPARAAPDVEVIHVHTEAWADYTERDGTGFAWDVLRAVYNPAGIKIDRTIVPYTRAVHAVLAGRADAWVGAYEGEFKKALYPKWHYDADEVEALFRAENLDTWQGPSSLESGSVGWVRGYEYDKYLDQTVNKTLLNDRQSVFSMLKRGRLTYWLDAEYEINHLLKNRKNKINRDAYVRRKVMTQHLYVPFAPNERGRALRRIWDRRMKEMLNNGRLAKIYERWNIAFWPFDQPRKGS